MMRLPTFSCLVLALATSAALAQDPAPPAAGSTGQGDPQNGRALTYTCHGCHGVPGYENVYPTYRVPKIGGQSQAYLVNALTAYRNGERPHPTMQAQAESFTEADIADIAAFLSSLQP